MAKYSLKEYAHQNNTEFHIITYKPTTRPLLKSYHDAVDIIKKAKAPAEVYSESGYLIIILRT